MAAITTIIAATATRKRIRTITASSAATADAVAVPQQARFVTVIFRATVVTTSMLPNVSRVDWGATAGVYDDGTAVNLGEHAAFTAFTAANTLIFQAGPGVTGIADDATNSATAASYVSVNCVLPKVIYIQTTHTGNSTATIDVEWSN
jgi:hypothetical protein